MLKSTKLGSQLVKSANKLKKLIPNYIQLRNDITWRKNFDFDNSIKDEFFSIYNDCFNFCFLEKIKMLFSTRELSSLDYLEFQKNFITRTPFDLKKEVNVLSPETKKIFKVLYSFWFHFSEEDFVPKDDNVLFKQQDLLLFNQIRYEKYKLELVLDESEFLPEFTSQYVELLLKIYNNNLLLLAELLYFRETVTHFFFNIRNLKFLSVSLFDFIVELDIQIGLLADRLRYFRICCIYKYK